MNTNTDVFVYAAISKESGGICRGVYRSYPSEEEMSNLIDKHGTKPEIVKTKVEGTIPENVDELNTVIVLETYAGTQAFASMKEADNALSQLRSPEIWGAKVH